MIHMASKHFIPTAVTYAARVGESISSVMAACPDVDLSVQRKLLHYAQLLRGKVVEIVQIEVAVFYLLGGYHLGLVRDYAGILCIVDCGEKRLVRPHHRLYPRARAFVYRRSRIDVHGAVITDKAPENKLFLGVHTLEAVTLRNAGRHGIDRHGFL